MSSTAPPKPTVKNAVPGTAVIRQPEFEPLPFPTDPNHPVVYLIQLEGNSPVPNVGGADVICVSWKQELPPCTFIPGSSWTQGRNHMWKTATTMKKKYMYYIFMDEDIKINNLTLFEDYLIKWQPPVGVPDGIAQLYQGIDTSREALILNSFDAAFDAFHYDVVHGSLILPYIDLFDKFSWWASQLYMIYLTQVLYENEVVGFMRVKSENPQHRPYPRGWNDTAFDNFFKENIIVDDRLRQSWTGYHWTSPGPAFPKPGKQRYHLPEDFLTLADAETVFWKRIAQIKASSDGRPPLDNAVAITGEDHQKMFGIVA